MRDTVLYFGSYNPVHRGHIEVARYVAGLGPGEVWMVVSPRNPLKDLEELAPDEDRLRMVEIAVETAENQLIKACGIEFGLPRPSYTIDTLRELGKRCPDRRFTVLAGSDILGEFHRWKDHQAILDDYGLMVYPRPGSSTEGFAGRVKVLENAPPFDYSSTQVRQALCEGRDCSRMLDPAVYAYIKEKNLWKRKQK